MDNPVFVTDASLSVVATRYSDVKNGDIHSISTDPTIPSSYGHGGNSTESDNRKTSTTTSDEKQENAKTGIPGRAEGNGELFDLRPIAWGFRLRSAGWMGWGVGS